MHEKQGFEYKGKYTNEISFPIGGIGSGCIGLAGNGSIVDFEIFNRPNKNSYNGYTHIAVKAEDDNSVIDARVLNGDLKPPYMGDINAKKFNDYGFGVFRSTMAGCHHFEDFSFIGEFPFANMNFSDSNFPGEVKLVAFNPFIPLNDKDSSLPVAFFEVEFNNNTDKELTYTAAFSLSNPAKGENVHTQAQSEDNSIRYVFLDNEKYRKDMPEYGNMCVATDCLNSSAQQYWFRGGFFDNLEVFWQDFTCFGQIKNRVYPDKVVDVNPFNLNDFDTATIYATVKLAPSTTDRVRFIMSWYYPNVTNYWNPEKCNCEGECETKTWKNYYSTLFESSKDFAVYGFKNYERLKEETRLFCDALFSSSVPDSVLDAVSANISILKSPTCLRLEDGSFYGFEGCACNEGCCEGSCTHVWNYAYALPFLFPSLERSMRELDYKYNMDEHGGMAFRLQLPLGRERSKFRPCVDGQFGGVIKVYRDWKICADDNWLKEMWPYVKKSIEYAWSPNNYDKWDKDKTGVIHGRQHHTLDTELFGPNSWLTGFYLAALKAASEMANYLGEEETAEEYESLFNKGKTWVEENLFNGQFYFQKIDVRDKSILDSYDDSQNFWNDEAKEIKHQIGEGSVIDQVIAQWHANICGLGEIFNKNNVKKSLETIYKHNYKKSMRNYFNPCRLYCLNDESGTVICDWPDLNKKPTIPVPYSRETMHGFEYQVATHMLQEGMIEEGIELIKAVRDRYDGYRRNPWNEIECGSNYARSMASYVALNAFSGFTFDMPNKLIGFNPIVKGDFKCFWSLDCGWGIFELNDTAVVIKVLYGHLSLKSIKLPFLINRKINKVVKSDCDCNYKYLNEIIEFEEEINVMKDQSIIIYIEGGE